MPAFGTNGLTSEERTSPKNISENCITTELRDHIANFIQYRQCYGLNGYGDTQEFVPQAALLEFWSLEKVTTVLCQNHDKWIICDPGDIMKYYIVVFSILVLTSGAENLELFTQEDIRDSSLPLSSTPKCYLNSPFQDVFESFMGLQWKFCPLFLDLTSGLKPCKRNLSPEMVLPISRKTKINIQADEENSTSILYKVEFHRTYTKVTAPIVFKEYVGSSLESQTLYENERAMYSYMEENSFNHIIKYYGSFACLGRRTIILEYAPGGDLLAFFKQRKIPRTSQHREEFWRNMSGLVKGLVAIDDFTRHHRHTKDTWRVKGTHQDIRPQNILICGDPLDDDYSVPFKFADMGRGHVRKVKNGGIDMYAVDQFGNGMYSAPEACRDIKGATAIDHKSDVYALGGIFSEALIWSIWGEPGRETYQAERVERTRNTRLRGGYHEGTFHDGDRLLDVVELWHDRAVKITGGRAEVLSRLILSSMLAADSPKRKTAEEIMERLEAIIPTLGSNTNYVSQPKNDWPSYQLSLATHSCPAIIGLRDGHQSPTNITRSLSNLSLQSYPQPHPQPHQAFTPLVQRRRASDASIGSIPVLSDEKPPDSREATIRRVPSSYLRALSPSQPCHSPVQMVSYSGPATTIDQVYMRCLGSKLGVKNTLLRSLRWNAQTDDVFKQFPELKTPLARLRGKTGRSQVLTSKTRGMVGLQLIDGISQIFILDDSRSMESHREQLARTIRVLSKLLKKGQVDTDKEFELYFASTGDHKKARHSTDLQSVISAHSFSNSRCEMHPILDKVATKVIEEDQLVSIYVLTNGHWDLQDQRSLCGVDKPIERLVRQIVKGNKQANWANIQFIGFHIGLHNDGDRCGKARMRYLNYDLNLERDIVDNQDASGDVGKILLGSLSAEGG